jgi:FkbM family methyltransferase
MESAVCKGMHMMQLLLWPLKIARSSWRIMTSHLSKRLKRQILKSYLITFVLKRFNARENCAHIAGYKVTFVLFWALRSLFHEIFIEQAYYFKCDTPDPFIIDCGSNIGMSVLFFKALYPRAQLLAFEPDERAFSCLETNVKSNDLRDVVIHKKAVVDKEGEIAFYENLDRPGPLTMSTMAARTSKDKQYVDGTVLSNYINSDVDFVKIDIEGAELPVLKELCASGKLPLIKKMAIEYHHHLVEREDTLSELLSILEGAGFGYQLGGVMGRPFPVGQFQDILIFAYKKDVTA